jgi:hypothetical protein
MANATSSTTLYHTTKLAALTLESTRQSRKFGSDLAEARTRFVWLTPSDLPSGQCLHAFTETTLIGRSEPLEVRHSTPRKRNTLASINDPYGAWFDGVTYLKSQNNSASFIAGTKDQKIAILGGGMSGLMSALLLDEAGIHDWEISESSQRIGG